MCAERPSPVVAQFQAERAHAAGERLLDAEVRRHEHALLSPRVEDDAAILHERARWAAIANSSDEVAAAECRIAEQGDRLLEEALMRERALRALVTRPLHVSP